MKLKVCRECGVNYQTEKCPKCGSILHTTWESLGSKDYYRIATYKIWESLTKKRD